MTAIALLMVSCGGSNGQKGEAVETSAESAQVATEQAAPAKDVSNFIAVGDGIAVFQASRLFDTNENHGILSVSFREIATKQTVKFESNYDEAKNAEEWGFSSKSAKLTTFYMGDTGPGISYEATEENYGEAVDITYTPNPAHPIKSKDGKELKAFTVKVPYNNVELI